MSQWGILVPVAAITVGPVLWTVNNWIRVRHGHEPERFGKRSERRNRDQSRTIELLTADNDKLTGQVSRLEERIRVLERIATDPATRTAQAIEALRD
jgi:hypothetical protein